ncbi:MAG: helix-turn-helix domain-containing protein [Chloroflexota bacterium]
MDGVKETAAQEGGGNQQTHLSQIEAGKRKHSMNTLSALAKALKVPMEEVIAREAE